MHKALGKGPSTTETGHDIGRWRQENQLWIEFEARLGHVMPCVRGEKIN